MPKLLWKSVVDEAGFPGVSKARDEAQRDPRRASKSWVWIQNFFLLSNPGSREIEQQLPECFGRDGQDYSIGRAVTKIFNPRGCCRLTHPTQRVQDSHSKRLEPRHQERQWLLRNATTRKKYRELAQGVKPCNGTNCTVSSGPRILNSLFHGRNEDYRSGGICSAWRELESSRSWNRLWFLNQTWECFYFDSKVIAIERYLPHKNILIWNRVTKTKKIESA